MANLAKIEYDDKSNVNDVINRQIQATAEDFNDIKNITNAVVDAVNGMKCDQVDVITGINTVIFNDPYPAGYEFIILYIVVTDATGLHVGYVTSNKSENGFDITVAKSGTLRYLTMPRR